MKGYFFIDFISSVPYIWFYKERILPPGPNSNSILLIPEILPLIKIARIYTLRFYVRQIIAVRNSHKSEQNFAQEKEKKKYIYVCVYYLIIMLIHKEKYLSEFCNFSR